MLMGMTNQKLVNSEPKNISIYQLCRSFIEVAINTDSEVLASVTKTLLRISLEAFFFYYAVNWSKIFLEMKL